MANDATTKPKTETNGQTIIEEKVTKSGVDPFTRKYAQGRMLGKGGFAKCYEVTNIENKKVNAAKIICKATLNKSRAKQKLISEIKIHKSLNHTNIVGFDHVFEDQENVYILLELCDNQSLYDLLKRRKRLSELEVQCYVIQMINGLKYLHSKKVIHRDLKLGNLFLNDKMEIKIGDFGLAAKLEVDTEKRRTVCGTPNYIAPEIIEGKNGHSYEVDTWSLGVIIYTLLVGRPPFETADVKLTYKKIKACSYAFPEQIHVSDTAKSLVAKILNLDPSKRPTLDEILQHPFLRNGNNIPKLLPTSTLTCAPSSSYLTKFSSPDNLIQVPSQPSARSIETAPLGIPKERRFINTQKNNLVGTDKAFVSNPGSATLPKSTNELSRQTSRGENEWNPAKTGAWHPSATSATSLKDLGRPHSVQQKDFRSTQGFKNSMGIPLNSLGSRLRISGVVSGASRDRLPSSTNEIWVKKWVDYSSKYGVGYVLSNGATGVIFNDNTKILLHSKGEQFTYVQRNDKNETAISHGINEYPKELQKKMTLLNHFRKHLEDNQEEIQNGDIDTNNGNVYVRKWFKTRNASMFRLSNKTVQVNFTDKTEIILNSEDKLVTYVNKKGERSYFPLTTALESYNTEMTKRLKYAKELLSSLVNGTQSTQIPTLVL